MPENFSQGTLFSGDFVQESITNLREWSAITNDQLEALRQSLTSIYGKFPINTKPNESQTEDDLIWPVLNSLGWKAALRQQNLAPKGREDVPDGLLFKDQDTKEQANKFTEEWKRYNFGLAIVESKRVGRPLDRRSEKRGEELAPSTQMLRYLRRVDDLTTGKLRWGILTNGTKWRLYYQGAKSVSEQFFEVDLAAILDIRGYNEGPFAISAEEREHWLKVFYLVFRREAFLPSASDERTFHQKALEEGLFYEKRVADSLSDVVFDKVFPELAKAIAKASSDTPLQEVREAALILLYRLLFILYAEDRNLLPVRDSRYGDYGLREKVRGDVGKRKDNNDIFSETAARYWAVLDDLCRAIDKGDQSIGLPPYNGGLFDATRTPLLAKIRLGDAVIADVIDALSFEITADGRKYINYRNLSVQQLGSIYERLLEHEICHEDGRVVVRPNIFARKGSGSYYTPDDLVALIIKETIEPLVEGCIKAFTSKVAELSGEDTPEERKLGTLQRIDPAEKVLELKICDPAMGSGHFLVTLVDYLTDQVITSMADAEAAVQWGEDHHYISPLSERIYKIRNTILGNAEDRGWTIDPEQLDDRHIIRRMVLKRCVYGVDKNLMAVELAKVALWLHTFTVGAPLSFLDHHLRCGDSLFGNWVKKGINQATAYGSALLLHSPITLATSSAESMQMIEGLTDAEIAEAHRSAKIFSGVKDMTHALDTLLTFIHALDWLDIKGKAEKMTITSFFDGEFGDPVDIVTGKRKLVRPKSVEGVKKQISAEEKFDIFVKLFEQAKMLIREENFLNWQVVFPGVWTDWQADELTGGFDAIIGNPPWDRIKLQQVEWFSARRPEIALAQKAADRERMIKALEKANDPLYLDFKKAEERAEATSNVLKKCGDYPLLSGGDVNLYSLFVERAMKLVKQNGMVGLLTPSGIASDKNAAPFFRGVSTNGRLKALYDFENRRPHYNLEHFFPDVDSRFKFCAFIASPSPLGRVAKCGFYLHSVSELNDPEKCFELSAEDFARVNPNTGTAPIFSSRRDADLTKTIYANAPILASHTESGIDKAWPVKYMTMFHMTNDSGLFRTKKELEEKEGAYPLQGNIWGSPSGEWTPLYVGKMVNQYDHRASSVEVNPDNLHNAALSSKSSSDDKKNKDFIPEPQYWVPASAVKFPPHLEWMICFRDIARATDARTIISSVGPFAGYGNKLPLIYPSDEIASYIECAPMMLANLNSIPFDYVARSKIHSTSVNWYLVEQLPVISLSKFHATKFGSRTAGDIIKDAVIELTYTSTDMSAFAYDMNFVGANGKLKPPFVWGEDRRLRLRAKLDAVFFILYGITNRGDVRYIYSTFPIIEREEVAKYGKYLSRDLCLAYINALQAGDPDAEVFL